MLDISVLDFYEGAARSRDAAELRSRFHAFASACNCTVGCVLAHYVDWRKDWRVGVFGDLADPVKSLVVETERRPHDPVWHHCTRSSAPIVWDRATYQRAGQVALWDAMAQAGVRSGIAAPSRSQDRVFILRLDSEQLQVASSVEISQLVGRVQLLATYADAAAQHLGLFPTPDPLPIELASLTPRELEVLKWAADGKTEWETGKILSLSQHTVSEHLESAARRLNCATKIQAVVRAYRAGLL